jgi:hypothetical protein
MQKPTAARILYGLPAGVILLSLAAWLSGMSGTVCEYNQSTHQNDCATYSSVEYLLVKSTNF